MASSLRRSHDGVSGGSGEPIEAVGKLQHRFPGVGVTQLPGHLSRLLSTVEPLYNAHAVRRRAILSLLASSERSAGEIERQLRLPQPTVSKHLRVLREAGFVEATVDAQRRLYRLRPEPLQEVDAWLAQFRQFWSHHLDALERHLDRMGPGEDQAPPAKSRTGSRRRGPRRESDKGETK